MTHKWMRVERIMLLAPGPEREPATTDYGDAPRRGLIQINRPCAANKARKPVL